MSVPRLSVNGLLLPYQADAMEQTYAEFGGFTDPPLRFADGADLYQERWRKIRTTLSGQGLMPVGLAAIDWSAPVTLGCVAAKGILSASNAITLPTARRNDVSPYGFAITADGLFIPTTASLAGDVLTLAVVDGAPFYQALYFPQLTVRAPSGVPERTQQVGLVIGWELTAEEI